MKLTDSELRSLEYPHDGGDARVLAKVVRRLQNYIERTVNWIGRCRICDTQDCGTMYCWDCYHALEQATGEEIDRLLAERESLPHFADDVIAYPGMPGWFPGEDKPGIVGTTGLACGNEEWGAETCECFSTQEAAEAAGGE